MRQFRRDLINPVKQARLHLHHAVFRKPHLPHSFTPEITACAQWVTELLTLAKIL
jgi:hypothetical protein